MKVERARVFVESDLLGLLGERFEFNVGLSHFPGIVWLQNITSPFVVRMLDLENSEDRSNNHFEKVHQSLKLSRLWVLVLLDYFHLHELRNECVQETQQMRLIIDLCLGYLDWMRLIINLCLDISIFSVNLVERRQLVHLRNNPLKMSALLKASWAKSSTLVRTNNGIWFSSFRMSHLMGNSSLFMPSSDGPDWLSKKRNRKDESMAIMRAKCSWYSPPLLIFQS